MSYLSDESVRGRSRERSATDAGHGNLESKMGIHQAGEMNASRLIKAAPDPHVVS